MKLRLAAFLCVLGIACATSQGPEVLTGGAAEESSARVEKSDVKPESTPSTRALSYVDLETKPFLVNVQSNMGREPMKTVLPWHRTLVESLSANNGRSGTATEGMRCLAAELARHLALEDGMPTPSRLRFFELRCGTWGIGTNIQFEMAELTEPLPGPDQLWTLWGPTLEALVASSLKDSNKSSVFGVSVYVSSPRAVAVVTRQDPALQFEIESVPEEDALWVRGKFTQMVAGAAAVMTEGSLGYRACEFDKALNLPSFAFRCRGSSTDTSASTVEVFAREPGRLISSLIARLQVEQRSGDTPATFRLLDVESLKGIASEVGSPLWLAQLNELRIGGGLRPLSFEAEQSRVISKAQRDYLGALAAPDGGPRAESMALAMLAGWHSQVPVIGGAMTTKLVETTKPSEWLSIVLSEPSARMVLMNPDASRIAASFLELESDGSRGLSGLVVTYETLDPAFRDQAIVDLRRRWTLGPSQLVGPATLADQRSLLVGDAEQGRLTRPALLDNLLEQYSTELACQVQVTVVETLDLGSVTKPAWLEKFDGDVLLDVAYLGRSASEARTMWLLVIGLPNTCRK